MKEHPILFKGDMVQAILGEHKTQTRRISTPRNSFLDGTPWTKLEKDATPDWENAWSDPGPSPAGNPGPYIHLPFPEFSTTHRIYPRIRIGDKLWVRETFAIETNFNLDSNEAYPPPFSDGRPVNWITNEHYGDHWEQCHYRATDPTPQLVYEYYGDGEDPTVRWKPSIHMPRWASRLKLEVVDVRAERIKDITPEDCFAEGISVRLGIPYEPELIHAISGAYQEHFKYLWDSINAKRGYSWVSNPWVWVYNFEVAE